MREEEKYLLLQAERIGQAPTLPKGMPDTARHCQEECQTQLDTVRHFEESQISRLSENKISEKNIVI